MPLLIDWPELESHIKEERQARGIDRYDEVWDGTYVIVPPPDNEHQNVLAQLCVAFFEINGQHGPWKVLPGVNVSDRVEGWLHNFRCPNSSSSSQIPMHGAATPTGAAALTSRSRSSAPTTARARSSASTLPSACASCSSWTATPGRSRCTGCATGNSRPSAPAPPRAARSSATSCPCPSAASPDNPGRGSSSPINRPANPGKPELSKATKAWPTLSRGPRPSLI